jgi:nucleoside-diphosphate-sugar epimerase
MRAFVAGASGAIGRPVVRELVAAGHDVTGMTRREDAAEEVRAAGAEGAVCDVFDPAALNAAVAAARPDVLVHQLTALPERLDFRDPDLYTATSRVRTEGTRNLIAAARAAGARRFVAQSIVFVYAPVGEWVVDEDAPVIERAPPPFGKAWPRSSTSSARCWRAEGMEGLVLRYGFSTDPAPTMTRGPSNAKAKRELGWAPLYESWRQGFRKALG